MLRRLNRGLIVCTMLSGWTGTASWARGQSTIYVDGSATGAGTGINWADAYPSLQPALAAAVSGDQIWVASDRYVSTIGLAEGVALYGGFAGTEEPATYDLADRDFVANETILDGNHAGSVVTAPPGATASTRIDGFTITNGGKETTYASPPYGGGILMLESSPMIANNRITGNIAKERGGGIYVYNASPTITNNMIADNTCRSRGGGICVYSGSPVIVGNTITRNSAKFSGGGLYVQAGSPVITDNAITRNQSDQDGTAYAGGGGVYADSTLAHIANNMITGNVAMGFAPAGGGLYLKGGAPRIENNTIAGNGAASGGGLFLGSSPADIANNTIVGNVAITGGGIYLGASSPIITNTIVAFNASGIYRSGTTSTPTFIANCVYGNNSYDYSGLADPTGTNGNLSADPRLASSEYDNWHIQPDSPCVNSGDIAYTLGTEDLDGQARVQPPGGSIDIGADESDGAVWSEGPKTIVRVSPIGDDAANGDTWATAKRTVQAGITAAADEGGEVWVQAGTYLENIQLFPYAHLYGGFNGNETARSQRNWQNNVTILDGWAGWRSVVRIHGGNGLSTLDGFTITRGRYGPNDGGGVSVRFSSPTIANNRITDNSNGRGGGLYLYSSSPLITNNVIVGNHGTDFGGGGGMYAEGSSNPTVTKNVIESNSAWYGGGILQSGGSAYIAKNLIKENAFAWGAGLALFGGSTTVANNRFVGNQGIAIYVEDPGDNASQTITNNTIIGNQGLNGAGLYLFGGNPSSTVANNIVAFNASGIYRYWSTPTLTNNCVYENTNYNYYGFSDLTGVDGNISVDPLFAQDPDPGPDGIWAGDDDDPGDSHLLAASPCINAGDNAVASGAFDLDDGPRLVGCRVDMGAYEYQVVLPLPADFDDSCVVDLDDYLVFELCLYSSGPGEQPPFWECQDTFDLDDDDDVDLADYAALTRLFGAH